MRDLKTDFKAEGFMKVWGYQIRLVAVFLGSFLLTVVISHFTSPTFNSEALVDPSNYYINISSLSGLGMELETTPDGIIGGIKDMLNVKTNIASGFKLFLSSSSSEERSNYLNKDGVLSASDFFKPATGTVSAPKELEMNSWGFALKREGGNPFSMAFDSLYSIPYPAKTSKWAGVGVKTNPSTILTTDKANSDPGVNLEVYYGLRANMRLPKGVYRSEVVYTALANLSSISGATVGSGYELEVAPAKIETDEGQIVTIKTSIFGKTVGVVGVGGSATVQNPEMGEVAVEIGEKECSNLSFNFNTGLMNVACTAPAHENGRYDIRISIPKHGIMMVKTDAVEYKINKTFGGIKTMQEMTPEICKNETTPNVSATVSTKIHSADKNLVPEAELKDTRDGKTYVIRKLADGKCWMVQNLDLDLSTGTALSSATSDVSSNWTPNNNTQTSAGTNWSESTFDNQTRSYNPGDKYLTGIGSDSQVVSDSGPKTAHVGNLYNWYAATAGSGTYSMSTPGQEAQHSICPKGWSLPYGNNGRNQTEDFGDFRKLTNTSGITSGAGSGGSDNRLLSAPLSFVRSGYYNYEDGVYSNQGLDGYFWSRSVHSQDFVHNLFFNNSDVSPQYYNVRGFGFSVRCVARESEQKTFNSITTMQEMTPQICTNETTPNVSATVSTKIHSADKSLVPEAELKDVRDGKTYVVRKLADGKCWMVQNLDLDLSTGTALTPATSDVVNAWTPQNNTHNNTGVIWGGDNQQASTADHSYNPGEQYLMTTGELLQTVENSGPKTAHIGNLYNWYAATAGSGTYNMTTAGQEAPNSICPKGWKLPYGNNGTALTAEYGEFRKLFNTYRITSGAESGSGDPRVLQSPLSYVFSGMYRYTNGQHNGRASFSWLWGSSVYDQNYAHNLHFYANVTNPQNNSYKSNGFSVRCVAR